MDDDTLHIGEVFFDLCLDLMCDEVSSTGGHLAIDEEMQFNDTVESAFSDDTSIDIFHIFIFSYDFAYFLFHTRIDDFIEEFTHSGPTYVIDVVAHEATGDKRCPVCPRSELWSCEEGHERPDERYPCRDRIGEMVESISLHRSALEFPTYIDTTEK